MTTNTNTDPLFAFTPYHPSFPYTPPFLFYSPFLLPSPYPTVIYPPPVYCPSLFYSPSSTSSAIITSNLFFPLVRIARFLQHRRRTCCTRCVTVILPPRPCIIHVVSAVPAAFPLPRRTVPQNSHARNSYAEKGEEVTKKQAAFTDFKDYVILFPFSPCACISTSVSPFPFLKRQ